MDDHNEKIECRVCGKSLRELNYHLKKVHNLSVTDYRFDHPDAPIISPVSSERKSKSVTEARRRDGPRPIKPETLQKLSLAGKARHKRERERDPSGYLRRMQSTAEHARASKGEDYHHSDQTLAKMRGPRPHTVGRPMSDETKQKLSIAKTGKMLQPHTAETLSKMRQAWVRRKQNKEAYAAYITILSERGSTPEHLEQLRNRIAACIKLGNPR